MAFNNNLYLFQVEQGLKAYTDNGISLEEFEVVDQGEDCFYENPDGTSSNSRTQPPPEEGQNSVFHDLLGYGILAARFMLEYRGLISAAPTLPSVQVQPAIPNLPDSKG